MVEDFSDDLNNRLCKSQVSTGSSPINTKKAPGFSSGSLKTLTDFLCQIMRFDPRMREYQRRATQYFCGLRLSYC